MKETFIKNVRNEEQIVISSSFVGYSTVQILSKEIKRVGSR